MSARFCQAGREGTLVDSPSSRPAELLNAEVARVQRRCRITFVLFMVGCVLSGAAIILVMFRHASS